MKWCCSIIFHYLIWKQQWDFDTMRYMIWRRHVQLHITNLMDTITVGCSCQQPLTQWPLVSLKRWLYWRASWPHNWPWGDIIPINIATSPIWCVSWRLEPWCVPGLLQAWTSDWNVRPPSFGRKLYTLAGQGVFMKLEGINLKPQNPWLERNIIQTYSDFQLHAYWLFPSDVS